MEGREGAQWREGEGRKMQEEEKHVSVVECVSSCVCLCMREAACMHVPLHIFMHECVCVQHGRWVWCVQQELFIEAASPSC